MNEPILEPNGARHMEKFEQRVPAAINVSRADRTISIEWPDTHRTVYKLDDLRSMCDCAQCRADREKAEENKTASPRTLPILGAVSRADISSINHVGRYALGVGWKDGHQSIFTYQYLFEGCLCESCSGVEPTV